MYRTASQVLRSGGSTGPCGAVASRQTTAMATICTADMPNASPDRDHWPSPTMCRPYKRAEARVSHTPLFTDRPLSESRASPPVASSTASHTRPSILWRKSTVARIGVKTTYMPVTKPLTLGAISDRPQVCRSWPPP
ncbi:MAG: hypothetical protein WDW36_005047 [Sanguina aurantia]